MKTSVKNIWTTSDSHDIGKETPIADANGNLMLNKLKSMLIADAIPSVPLAIVEELMQDFRARRSEIEKLKCSVEETVENLNSYITNYTDGKPKHTYTLDDEEYVNIERSFSWFDNITDTSKVSNQTIISLIKAHGFHKKYRAYLSDKLAVFMKLQEESSEVFEE